MAIDPENGALAGMAAGSVANGQRLIVAYGS